METRKLMKVLILGSNPSTSSTSPLAFDLSTKSGRTLAGWLRITSIDSNIVMYNVSNTYTIGNRPLRQNEMGMNLARILDAVNMERPDRIVAVGKIASKALTLLRLSFFELPHPSGCNRLLNDPKFIEEKIKGLRDYFLNAK